MPVLKIGWLRWWYSLNISLISLCTPNFLKFGKKRIPVPIRQDDLKGKRGLFFVKHWGFCSPRITIAGHHLSRIMMSIGSYGSLKFKKKQYLFAGSASYQIFWSASSTIFPSLCVFIHVFTLLTFNLIWIPSITIFLLPLFQTVVFSMLNFQGLRTIQFINHQVFTLDTICWYLHTIHRDAPNHWIPQSPSALQVVAGTE